MKPGDWVWVTLSRDDPCLNLTFDAWLGQIDSFYKTSIQRHFFHDGFPPYDFWVKLPTCRMPCSKSELRLISDIPPDEWGILLALVDDRQRPQLSQLLQNLL